MKNITEQDLKYVADELERRRKEREIAMTTARRLRQSSQAVAYSAFSSRRSSSARPSTGASVSTESDTLTLLKNKLNRNRLREVQTDTISVVSFLDNAAPVHDDPVAEPPQVAALNSDAVTPVVNLDESRLPDQIRDASNVEAPRCAPAEPSAHTQDSQPPVRPPAVSRPPIPFRKRGHSNDQIPDLERQRVECGLPRQSGLDRNRSAPAMPRRLSALCSRSTPLCAPPAVGAGRPPVLRSKFDATKQAVGPAIAAGTGMTWEEEQLLRAIAETNAALQAHSAILRQ